MNPRSLLCSATALFVSAIAGTAAEIELKSPLDYQVVQRTDRDHGTVNLRGHVNLAADEKDGKTGNGALQWQYRLVGQSPDGKPLEDAWHEFPKVPEKGDFDFGIAVPAGGWYRLEVRAATDDKALAAVSVEHVGVGEVFIVAGQSNAGSYGADKQRVQSGMVTNFDGKTWAIADDPQRGAGGFGGSFIPSFGDGMFEKSPIDVFWRQLPAQSMPGNHQGERLPKSAAGTPE